jgi:putative ATP-dependent endonuclease of OLD family
MYLKRLAIINYKSCQGVLVDCHKDAPTTFIGINDAGKSAVLKAIGLLLEQKTSFNVSTDARFTSDISNTPLAKEDQLKIFTGFGAPPFAGTTSGAAIVGEFVIEDGEINDDFIETASPQLKWAIESRKNDTILVLRLFENTNSTGRYFLCLGESEEPLNLWAKKASELQTLKKQKNVSDEEVKNDNKKGRFASIEIIRAIYNKVGFKLMWADAAGFAKDDLELFPRFRYIDWNASLSDLESLANDVMKRKIDVSKAKLVEEAGAASKAATEEVNKEFQVLTDELTKDLKTVSAIKAQVIFSVSEKVSDLVINKTTGDGDIRLDSQGEGVKRQILFAFLKWASRGDLVEGVAVKRFIWCFDEPEAHLYPTAQRELYTVICGLARSNFQIVLGTHSTIFVDRLRLSDMYKIRLNDKYSEILKCGSVDDVHEVLGVRNSDILFFDTFFAVEGECERLLVPYFFRLYTGVTLEERSIKLIPLGGISQYKNNKEILERILGDFKKTDSVIYYIFDADTAEVGTNVHLLGKCDLEDLIPNEHWIRLLKEECGVEMDESELDALRGKIDPVSSATKLYKLLADKIASIDSRIAFLPPKSRCAEAFQSYIVDKAAIPTDIQKIFEKVEV